MLSPNLRAPEPKNPKLPKIYVFTWELQYDQGLSKSDLGMSYSQEQERAAAGAEEEEDQLSISCESHFYWPAVYKQVATEPHGAMRGATPHIAPWAMWGNFNEF